MRWSEWGTETKQFYTFLRLWAEAISLPDSSHSLDGPSVAQKDLL